MFKLLSKIISILFFWALFAFVVLQIPYPTSLTEATIFQLLGFLTPLFLAITFTLNLLFRNIFSSGSISLGIIFLLILKALNSLNIVSVILLMLAVGLLFTYFQKNEQVLAFGNKKSNLTKMPKIPKLTNMRKHNSSS